MDNSYILDYIFGRFTVICLEYMIFFLTAQALLMLLTTELSKATPPAISKNVRIFLLQ